MEPTLHVEFDTLRAAANSLGLIERTFRSAETDAERVADAVGHPGLSARLLSFASSWDTRRGEVADQVAALRMVVDKTVQAFSETDATLAQSLRAER